MIGDQNLEFDRGRVLWKPAAGEVLTPTAGSTVPLPALPHVPDVEDQHEEEEPQDNAHQQDIEEEKHMKMNMIQMIHCN